MCVSFVDDTKSMTKIFTPITVLVMSGLSTVNVKSPLSHYLWFIYFCELLKSITIIDTSFGLTHDTISPLSPLWNLPDTGTLDLLFLGL